MRLFFVLTTGLAPLWGLPLHMARVACFTPGAYGFNPVVCADLNSNGRLDASFSTIAPWQWQTWEWTYANHYRLIRADTAVYWQIGIFPGFFIPTDFGDFDADGLPELLGEHREFFNNTGGSWVLIALMECPHPESLPTRLAWYARLGQSGVAPCFSYMPGDLDRDGRNDIVVANTIGDSMDGLTVYEQRGNDSALLVWRDGEHWTITAAIGDFDLDERTEMATCEIAIVRTVECRGDDGYWIPPWEDTLPWPNGYDVFAGRDVDRNGRPEFFVSPQRWTGLNWISYLYGWEATGNNQYQRFEVDSAPGAPGRVSRCGDLDGDGVDEIAWATGTTVRVYKGVQPGRYERVFETAVEGACKLALVDMNGNGYSEIVASAVRTEIYELEAVRVLFPNVGNFEPGDTCRISWETLSPPRCDSVSLFLKADTTSYPPHPFPLPLGGRGERRGGDGFRRLDTIATGLAPADTPYLWVVPDIRAESAWVLAVAYGPGWQYDESDSAIRILGTGAVEEKPVPVYETRLAVFPNPSRGRLVVEYELAEAGPVELVVLDATGRKVATLASGSAVPGAYKATWAREGVASGVYFLRLDTGRERRVVKVVAE